MREREGGRKKERVCEREKEREIEIEIENESARYSPSETMRRRGKNESEYDGRRESECENESECDIESRILSKSSNNRMLVLHWPGISAATNIDNGVPVLHFLSGTFCHEHHD